MKPDEDKLAELRRQINDDPGLTRRGRYYSVQFSVIEDERVTRFTIEDGSLTRIEVGSGQELPAAFSIASSREHWARFREPRPAPGYQDISAMIDRGYARFSGTLYPWLSNMLYIKGVIDFWRRENSHEA
jgi:hypothetical protein